MTVYGFDQQFAQGNKGENVLDTYFSRLYFVLLVPLDMQRLGIDRVFLNRESLMTHTIEYKTDSRAAQSGNVFIETVSIDRDNKPGWAYTSRADFLFYYLPQVGRVYCIEMSTLRRYLGDWVKHYPLKEIANKGYNTRGILVPCRDIVPIARLVHIPTN